MKEQAAHEELWENLGFSPADILLPRGVDLTRWSVIACDQFTEQKGYWEAVEQTVGNAPSALRVILPEARLNDPDLDGRIAAVNAVMEQYLQQGIFQEFPHTLLYVERVQSDGAIRHGLVGMIDLERYDYTPGSGALIRATEGTVLSRLPPRVKVRRNAPLELPHVMLLMDDPENRVLGSLTDCVSGGMEHRGGSDAAATSDNADSGMELLYDFSLQQGGGSIRGWKLGEKQMNAVAESLSALCTPAEMERKYGLKDAAPLLFAVGDGNHSLAAAKQCYEELKRTVSPDRWASLPARYAMVEVVNNHDPALRFEPIHRCIFGTDPEALIAAFRSAWPGAYEVRQQDSGEIPQGQDDREKTVRNGHTIVFLWQGHSLTLTVPNPTAQLAVGTLQGFLDGWLADHGGEIDYIHDPDAARALGTQPGNLACLLPAMRKEELFKTVMADGVLPRKTFSMGHARDKRYYLEARRI